MTNLPCLSRRARRAAVVGLSVALACLTGLSTAAPSEVQTPSIPELSSGVKAAASPLKPADKLFKEGVRLQTKGDVAGAKAQFEAGVRADPNHMQSLIGLASVAMMQGQPAEAEKLIARADAANPKAPEVQMAWARFHAARRDDTKAEAALKKARTLAPDALPPYVELGMLYLRTGRAPDALKAFREASLLDSSNKYVAFGQGMAAAGAGERVEAVVAFEKAAKLGPKDAGPLRMLGKLHQDAGDEDKALAAFDRGLKRQPTFVPLMLDRAETLGRLKRAPAAVDQALAAERLAPRVPDVLLRVADVLQGAQRWDDAQKRYLQVIELAPKQPVAYNNLAWMTVERKGDANQAVAWARQAVALANKVGAFHDTLGWALRASGDLKAAAAGLGEAVRLDGKSARYNFHLGVVQAEQNDHAAARKSLQMALDLDAKFADAEQARRLLAALPKS